MLLTSLLHPPVLFFFVGLLAAALRSDLEVPAPLSKFLSLYLLLAIGYRGGVELAHSPLDWQMGQVLLAGTALAIAIPLALFAILRPRFGGANAAAVAASYGSVSAVTFIAGVSLLDALAIPYSGYMLAALALMESPAIIVAVALYHLSRSTNEPRVSSAALLRETLLNGSVVLLLSSVAIGMISSEAGRMAMEPFTTQLFTGILCLFLLDMGIASARRLKDLRSLGFSLVGFALAIPLASGALAIVIASWLAMPAGDAFLFCVLCASASYIAVPAALRHAIPEASPGGLSDHGPRGHLPLQHDCGTAALSDGNP